MVTNQPDVHRGLITMDFVREINKALNLPLDGTYICPHITEVLCDCRKPRTLLFRQAAEELSIDLRRSYMVGDTWRDVEAGTAAGCRTVWIRHPETPVESMPPHQPHVAVTSLAEAAAWILGDSK
jgi:D-glycero-D-manno-heptose 1,7-bisphosphate phosphatase